MAVRAFPRVARRASTMLWSSVAAGKDCSKRARGSRFQPGYATRGALSQAAAFFSPAHKRSRSIGSSLSIRAFLAGCYEKAEELDDSSGSFGQFVGELICGWIKARQASGAEADETAALLLARMDDDPYGFCHRIEKDAAKAFDKAGLAAFERQARARFEAAATAKPARRKPTGDQPEHLRRHYGGVLRTIYLARKNLAAYVALTTETGLTVQDCHAVATMPVIRRKPDEALAWVKRGVALDRENPHG